MIYFDNAATTHPIAEARVYHNPSSPHALGIKAERAIRAARATLASVLGCASDEIIFTSGGTESNNLAILGYTLAHMKLGVCLITSPYEHPSILGPMQFADERGWGKAHVISTSQDNIAGLADAILYGNSASTPDDSALTDNTLISVSHVNHETGDINNINAISTSLKKIIPGVKIHVDGAQGFCKENINLRNIDLYSFSGHKIHGPVGAGGLWVRKGVRLVPLQHGGGQEGGMRSGTENVGAITQLAEAAGIMHHGVVSNRSHVADIKAVMLSLHDALSDVCINVLGCETSPYILNMSFLGVKGEVLVHALSEKGIYVSVGAACRSRKRARSALEIMGFAPEIAESAIRFSFSPYNTLEETEQARDTIIKEVTRLRKVMSVRVKIK